jgi:hypothetical protein
VIGRVPGADVGYLRARVDDDIGGSTGFSRLRLDAVAHQAIDDVSGQASIALARQQREQCAGRQPRAQNREGDDTRLGFAHSPHQITLALKAFALVQQGGDQEPLNSAFSSTVEQPSCGWHSDMG